jgi:hypothetical protein
MSKMDRLAHFFFVLSPLTTALMWGAYAIGLLSSLFAYLYLRGEFNLSLNNDVAQLEL